MALDDLPEDDDENVDDLDGRLSDIEDAKLMDGTPQPISTLRGANPAIKNAIQGRSRQIVPTSLADIEKDPAFQILKSQQGDLQGLRQAQLASDYIGNLGHAAGTLAQGANSVKPDTAFDDNLNKQSQGLIAGQQHDLDTQAKVVGAIQGRNAKLQSAGIAADSREKVANALNGQRQQRLDNANIKTTNSLLNDPNITRETTKLNSASTLNALIAGIRSGEITDSTNVRNTLTNELNQINLGNPGGQGDREKTGISNFYTAISDLASKVSSTPLKSIPPKYLDQVENEGNAMADRAAKNYAQMGNAKMAGTDVTQIDPDAEPGPVTKLMQSRLTKFLGDKGYKLDGTPAKERDPMVDVVAPDGTPGQIKKSKLQDAKKMGFTVHDAG